MRDPAPDYFRLGQSSCSEWGRQCSRSVKTEVRVGVSGDEGSWGPEQSHTHLIVNLTVHLTVAAGAALLGREWGL